MSYLLVLLPRYLPSYSNALSTVAIQRLDFFSPPGEGGSKNPCPTLSSRDSSLEDQTPRSGDWPWG